MVPPPLSLLGKNPSPRVVKSAASHAASHGSLAKKRGGNGSPTSKFNRLSLHRPLSPIRTRRAHTTLRPRSVMTKVGSGDPSGNQTTSVTTDDLLTLITEAESSASASENEEESDAADVLPQPEEENNDGGDAPPPTPAASTRGAMQFKDEHFNARPTRGSRQFLEEMKGSIDQPDVLSSFMEEQKEKLSLISKHVTKVKEEMMLKEKEQQTTTAAAAAAAATTTTTTTGDDAAVPSKKSMSEVERKLAEIAKMREASLTALAKARELQNRKDSNKTNATKSVDELKEELKNTTFAARALLQKAQAMKEESASKKQQQQQNAVNVEEPEEEGEEDNDVIPSFLTPMEKMRASANDKQQVEEFEKRQEQPVIMPNSALGPQEPGGSIAPPTSTKQMVDSQSHINEAMIAAAEARRSKGLDPRSSPEVAASAWEAQLASYSQLAEARGRMQNRLFEANRYIRHLENEKQDSERLLVEVRRSLNNLSKSADAMSRQLLQYENAASGTNLEAITPEDLEAIASRYHTMADKARGLSEDAQDAYSVLDAGTVREVPLTWCGVADNVEVRGTWDTWMGSVRLSPEDSVEVSAGNPETEFTATLQLKPGRYEFKFVVDGQWRIVPGWPTVGFGLDENLILDVN
ncbi:hypothetical protein PPROV_000732500 [Pycnococcus provasolii]|uniref:AMP-activated protein kinase glycogen-binding domain-containing protein n=1 Tax=Pycnococcus provasolii TaxID=41880 RepID=A0A830HNS7_9CHLO|nr:hypothetical protein PPROV_000732500 [Pycnococcus provasolii]